MRAPETLIVTAFNHELYESYAHRFIDTFPKTLDLAVFSEDPKLSIPHTTLPLDFYNRNKDKRVTSYKVDAVRFHWKPLALLHALDLAQDYDSILWIDADTVFLEDITQQWIDENLRTDAIMTYAGRPNYYSECGLLWFNLNNPHTTEYINSVWNLYETDELYKLEEQHDSYIWDYVRKQYEEKGLEFNNIGVDYKVPGGHILVYLFGDVMDHLKGKRKQQGYSQERKNKSNS